MKSKQEVIKTSGIIAICIVSAMDIAQVKPDFTYKWSEDNKEEFNNLLWQFGMDTIGFIEKQESVTHRTRLNRTVTCDRWVGNERFDKEWVESGYASRESRDKASGSSLLNDLYRAKGLSV
jgi:hypothetical protein